VLKGNLFDFAIMKTSVISETFRERYLSTPGQENIFECRAVVFDGSDDYHARINDPALQIDENTLLAIRGAGPVGWPGSAEVVNMQPPDALIKRGVSTLPTLGDGRQSGTSDSPSILNASPESAVGGGLAGCAMATACASTSTPGRATCSSARKSWRAARARASRRYRPARRRGRKSIAARSASWRPVPAWSWP
jgi:dihydroxyacid dehydratase/phosphogluconate dehydratase